MNKNVLVWVLCSLLVLTMYVPTGLAHNARFPVNYTPNTLNIDTIAEPESLDPAWAYDSASKEVIMNVYETLVSFDKIGTLGPYASGQTSSFVPVLAAAVPLAYGPDPDGLGPKVATLTFNIAPGHRFSDGNIVTPEDVAYSFKRMLIQDRDGGPQWMLYYPLLGVYRAETPAVDANFDDRIDSTVLFNNVAGTVTINLEVNFPLTSFLQILSQTWSSVVEKAWAVGLGDFNGNFGMVGGNDWAAIYAAWHNPGVSFIRGKMMGSGPYMLNFWVHAVVYSITANNFYWQGAPRIGTVVWNVVPNWNVRGPKFLAGNSDLTYVDRQFRDKALGQPGIRAYYPTDELSLDAFFFTFNIATTSPYAIWNPPGVFNQLGIPPDIFSDVNVRKGFAYAFDYNSWLTAAYLGEGAQPADPIIQGLAYDNPNEEGYSFNLGMAAADLQAAWGGALWANGMSFTIVYNAGNVGRQLAANIIANNINVLNNKFHLTTLGVQWSNTYLPQMVAGELPIFITGWQADYTDPGNFAFSFMHSQGTFAASQGYSNARADNLITFGATLGDDVNAYNGQLDVANPIPLFNNAGGLPPDLRWPRRSTYYELQRIYFEDIPSVPLVQPIGRHFERDWVRGWYYNPLYGGSLVSGFDSPTVDIYSLWKAQTHFGDANNDGHVDVGDMAFIAAHWTAAGRPYDPAADINGGKGGLTGNDFIRGMPDGVIDIIDIGLVSAFWDGPPQGLAHP